MIILFAALLAAAMPAEAVPPARDGNIAIAEEFCAARRKGTLEAYDFFLARHPHHPLAAEARKERRQVAAGKPVGRAGPDCGGTP